MSILPFCMICDEPIIEDKCYDFQDDNAEQKTIIGTFHLGYSLDYCICRSCMDKELQKMRRQMHPSYETEFEAWIESHYTHTPTEEE